ncbi:MAG: DUF4154 domain-containing protein [Cellvibrionaceae bacterium]|nr:DUF4154 domain-containing protein [Cellvibrionaceae bacterium]
MTKKRHNKAGGVRRCVGRVLLLLSAIAATPLPLAQSVNKEQAIVSYVYNFATHIDWPKTDSAKTFAIVLYQVRNQRLVNEFANLSFTTKIHNKPIRLTQTNDIANVANKHLVYTEATDDQTIQRLHERIADKATLIVTANHTNKRLVMVNLFDTQSHQLQFEVNQANLINKNLYPKPDMILLGGTEIDVAKLYQQGQDSLIKLQRQVTSQQQRLLDLQQQIALQEATNFELREQMQRVKNAIKTSEVYNVSLESQLKSLEKKIQSSAALIKKQEGEIISARQEQKRLLAQVKRGNSRLQEQDKLLTLRQQQLDQSNEQLLRQVTSLNQQKTLLSQRKKQLDFITQSITEKEIEVTSLGQTIAQQEVEISQQQASISKLGKLVNAQKNALTYLWLSITLSLLFLITLIVAYRMKKQDNEKLSVHSQALQLARDKLEIAKRKAEAANQAKSQFLSLMSHELRTPLQAIIGYTDITIEDLQMNGNQQHANDLKRVNANGERLLHIINNTLDLAKIEAGKMDLSISPINLESLVDEAVGNIKPQMDSNENQLIVDIDDTVSQPFVDHEKLLHIIINLLSNAAKFTHKGTVTFSIKSTADQLRIIVKDTGIGLSKQQQDCIFTRFHQADTGNTRKFKGTGLGLSITQQFCELMGGGIVVDSTLGVGTTFIVTLPLPISMAETSSVATDVSDVAVHQ